MIRQASMHNTAHTVADVATETIFDIQVGDVREADYKSPCMEMWDLKEPWKQ